MTTDVATALRLECARDDLAAALGTVSRALSTRATVQVLGGIQLTPTSEGLELAATDMELSLRTKLHGAVEGDGAVVVPGKLFSDLARVLPDESVTIEYSVGEGVLSVM